MAQSTTHVLQLVELETRSRKIGTSNLLWIDNRMAKAIFEFRLTTG
jgi:hypothetical protein